MFELEKTNEVRDLIAITKSDSGISGPELAKAHIQLGYLLAQSIPFPPKDTTIVALMRGGMFFAAGMYFQMGCKFQTYQPKYERFIRPGTKKVVLVDAVINTGRTIAKILEPDMAVACCVINEAAVEQFADQLYAVRVSSNSFVGADVKVQSGIKGPDTAMRLFNLL